MSSKAPIIHQVAWTSLLLQMIIIGLFSLLFSLITPHYNEAILLACLLTLVLALVLRNTIGLHHRKGIRFTKAGRFSEAVPEFEKSYVFFTKHHIIDRFRIFTMLSSSRISYREMALCNLAFCHSQIGNGPLARKYYEGVLKENPNNSIAKAALNLMNSEKAVGTYAK